MASYSYSSDSLDSKIIYKIDAIYNVHVGVTLFTSVCVRTSTLDFSQVKV